MWGLSRSTRVFLRPGPTDLRLGFEALYGLVENQLQQNPLSGHLFLFCNRHRTRLKALCWDGSGLWLCTKRLEKGTFAWPQSAREAHAKIRLAPQALQLLLDGVDLKAGAQRAWYECAA